MMSLLLRNFLMFLCVYSWVTQVNAQSSPAAEKYFHEEVAPILVKNCIECHSSSNAKGGLNLEKLASALKGGDEGPAVVAGRAKDSLLYRKIVPASEGAKPEMPRKKPPLKAEEVKKIQDWIDSGAVWPKELVLKEKSKADGSFWSLRPVRKEAAPV
ncbi:MAG: c-type cytochrome domain-containing protein, partial [Gemmataceae bacterium]